MKKISMVLVSILLWAVSAQEKEQWVEKAVYWSSQKESDEGALEIVGPPDVYPIYGDEYGIWQQNSDFRDENQFIEVQFEEAVHISVIHIYETYHAGGITAIYARRGSCHNQWELMWTTDGVQDIESSRIFSPSLTPVDFPVKVVRIELDCQGEYRGIDAVQMTGTLIGAQEICYSDMECKVGVCRHEASEMAGRCACEADSNCRAGEVCASGNCQPEECGTDDDCENSSVCVDGMCQLAGCGTDVDCVNSEVCIDGECQECRVDADCPNDGETCNAAHKCQCDSVKEVFKTYGRPGMIGSVCKDGKCWGRGVKCDASTNVCKCAGECKPSLKCRKPYKDLFYYERDFMLSLSNNHQADDVKAFNSTPRYLDDLLNIDNPYFKEMVAKGRQLAGCNFKMSYGSHAITIV